MLSTEVATAIAALVIAVFAALIACGQILGQYLHTADGYRRCQSRVIGGWAANTHRRFRWRQLRFETIYATPRLGVVPESEIWHVKPLKRLSTEQREDVQDDRMVEVGAMLEMSATVPDRIPRPLTEISNSASSRERTFTPDEVTRAAGLVNFEQASYLASWVSLVDRLHRLAGVYQDGHEGIAGVRMPSQAPFTDLSTIQTVPCLVRSEQSWDFMPPEMLRPVATASLGDFIVLTHRLGMSWKEIQLGSGTLLAEGHGQAVTASAMRGFGMVLQYTRNNTYLERNYALEATKLLIPSAAADKLGFGILQGSLGIPDLYLQADDGGFAEVNHVMSLLNVTLREQNEVRNLYKSTGSWTGFSDLIGLVPPFLPLQGSTITTVRRPLDHVRGPLLWREGRAAFRTRLHHEILKMEKEEVGKGIDTAKLKEYKRLLGSYRKGLRTWPGAWGTEGEGKTRRNNMNKDLLAYLRKEHNWTTSWLHNLFAANKHTGTEKWPFSYRVLVGAHISQATTAHLLARENLKNGKKRELEEEIFVPGGMHMDLFETFHVYVDSLPQIVKRVKETCTCEDDEMIKLAWWIMMYRGICWYMSVSLLGSIDRSSDGRMGMIVPSSLWDSQVEVHIV